MTDPDEPDGPDDVFDFPDEEDGPTPVPSWLGAIGQMIAALLVVVGVVALFMGAAVVLRRLWP